MAEQNPIKCAGGQYRPFAPGDTLVPGIAPVIVGDGITGDGTLDNPLIVLPQNLNMAVEDTSSVDLELLGNLLRANVRISGDANNCLELRADGLYMACAGSGEAPATATTIAISAVTSSVQEGTAAQYRLTLDIPDLVDIDVNIAYSGSEETAHPGSYPDEIVTIPAGNLTYTFTKATVVDALTESTLVLTATITTTDHTPALTITTPSANVNITDTQALAGIIDDGEGVSGCNAGDNGPQEFSTCNNVVPSGGVAPYTYAWSVPGTITSGQGTPTICWEKHSPRPMFVNGPVAVTITDANGVIYITSISYELQIGGLCV